jgi:homospermidine synthase
MGSSNHPCGSSFWYGSTVSIEQVKAIAKHTTPTGIQVLAGIISAMAWAILHHNAGSVEPSDIPDFEFVMTVASPLLGDIGGFYTDWTPLEAAGTLGSRAVCWSGWGGR